MLALVRLLGFIPGLLQSVETKALGIETIRESMVLHKNGTGSRSHTDVIVLTRGI